MKPVKIYTTMSCPYCMRAKKLFQALGVSYEEIDVGADQTLRNRLVETYKWQTVPMIFIGEEFIGGFDDLAELQAQGKLMEKLNA
ncbi:MAG TPA: glutaredoxin [Candidatus Magasanikbacteria bacterium]|nr:MAG: glutaredoxin [Candidatus Magasanikbacteria bacterium RIFCSPLOWO2_02_FULL_47_16]OGH79491.1 MAG: glutaredoxin [Candidatus Magasanikbacteria bacterium RIFCSPHIGHO2_02_FULL_48_18]OGH83163.1 MAG: glutaredoxin [Candidatus Magasanikbacteria bacterium RIFCSPLOWO2_12_FULL_47_9b]HAZ28838.1 glutaredoxin [Candidatus Magasanikbacteria bacterium]